MAKNIHDVPIYIMSICQSSRSWDAFLEQVGLALLISFAFQVSTNPASWHTASQRPMYPFLSKHKASSIWQLLLARKEFTKEKKQYYRNNIFYAVIALNIALKRKKISFLMLLQGGVKTKRQQNKSPGCNGSKTKELSTKTSPFRNEND